MNPRRSASVGTLPREKKHFVSRNESSSGASLDVRCACQYFQCDSLLPERVNPAGDSRPTSAMGFHNDWNNEHEQLHSSNQFQSKKMNSTLQSDQLSSRSFNIGSQMHMDIDGISVRSMGARGLLDTSNEQHLDLSFVEKNPKLDEIARSRGLVVRRISDANDKEIGAKSTTFMAGHRSRQMSVGRLSSGGGREPDAWSMRSVTSLRRISRSPSKSDLFVADINIPTTRHDRYERHDFRSASTSRRTSNVDLSHFASHRGTPALLQAELTLPFSPAQPQLMQQLPAPQLNLIAPTPNNDGANNRPDFERISTSRQRSTSPTSMDYRVAKPPISTDYMRPDENKENIKILPLGELMPQNRPIEVSHFHLYSDYEEQETLAPQQTQQTNNLTTTWKPFGRANSPKPTTASTDSLHQVVVELEDFVSNRNIEDVYDNIRMQTNLPPTLDENSIRTPSLHPTEETNVKIINKVSMVDIDKLIQSETEKAVESRLRSQSPPSRPNRSKFPNIMDSLQLPSGVSNGLQQTTGRQQQALKRQRTPERNMSPDNSKKSASEVKSMDAQTIEMHLSGEHSEVPFKDAPSEVKPSYTSRFKSMFTHNKTEDTILTLDDKTIMPIGQKSPSPMRGKSPSPRREKSPSPMPAKLTGYFSKSKPTPMSIVASNAAVATKSPEKEPISVKVTETFSLKVDEMDQYNARPSKPPPSSVQATPPITEYSSREDFLNSEQSSVHVGDAFAPVVIPAIRRDQFMAGNRTFYSSHIDTHSHRSESELHQPSKEPSLASGVSGSHFPITKGTLISVPIQIGSSNSGDVSGQKPKVLGSTRSNLTRPPSADGRVENTKLVRKSSFMEGRTQSQDRAQKLHGSSEDLYNTRMTKTVSFHFDKRQSRLSEFESSNIKQQQEQQQKDKREFIESTYFSRDHEYEPIASPFNNENASKVQTQAENSELSRNIEKLHEEIKDAEDFQRDIEERYFSSEATTPRTDSRTDYEIHTSQVDSSALEELPLKPENRTKGFMASAQDRTRKMQAGIRSQAGKIKTKLRTPAKKPPSSSPKAKERKRFKAPEFSKIKLPEIKRPDMSKFKDIKRPEFTKFPKPDMSKFKLPEKFPTIKLRRSKSFKENEIEDEEMPDKSLQTDPASATQPQKKMFNFNFGTYPRTFRKKKKPLEPQVSLGTATSTEGVSVIPSTETQPSQESSSSPQGDRGPGPVRSRWADKFSDVSYNDSEGSRYRRYGSEQESFDRESSLERRMKDDLEETESEAQEMGILGRVAETKQFAEFDEENRAIHEISKLRAGEFRRRPMVHQDSDLRSEDSKEVEGWTEKEIAKNELLRKAELEAEASYMKYVSDDVVPQENQSVASSGKKVVMEEIDDDEFFLRKRGVSEDNIELREYISNAIREGYDRPFNTLDHVGQTSEVKEYGDYDIPPPKPKRLNKNYRQQDTSQDLEFQRSDYGDDLSISQNGSDFFAAPKRPLRKGRSRSKYSMDSQDFPVGENRRDLPYFDDDEEYLRPPDNNYKGSVEAELNDLDMADKQLFAPEPNDVEDGAPQPPPPPQAPRRRKRDISNSSIDKDSYINGFGGRSISNTRLQPTENLIVYRTEHEYPIPLALTPTIGTRKSRSTSRYEEDDQISYEVESLDSDNRNESQIDNRSSNGKNKYVIDMMENDGYAVVRKEHLPKPTPPARRKKFSRSPGERFTTIPSGKLAKDGTPPPPERPPPPRAYTPSTMEEPLAISRNNSTSSLDMAPQILEDDYEEPEARHQERAESPRNLQSGEIVNKMKFRPLPAPPRPPREKRQRAEIKSFAQSAFASLEDRDMADDRIASSSTADSYDPTDVDLEEEQTCLPEVEVSTQTDPLPDDFECEEFEITDDMKIIEPRINNLRKTLDELLREEELKSKATEEATFQPSEEEQLTRGLQRFRDANQRSLSERSRASSQADRSKSQSRPQTPSAVVIERRVSTPIPHQQSENMLEASLIVRPIDDLDLEEEALRREGLLTGSSQQSKSDLEDSSHDEEEESKQQVVSDYSRGPSSDELDAALDELRVQGGSNYEDEREENEQANINEYDSDEKYLDKDELSTIYRKYLSEDTSEKEGELKEPEKKIEYEYRTESEDIATTSVASEDERTINEITDGPKEEKDNLVLNVKVGDQDSKQDLTDTIEKGDIEEEITFDEPPLPPPRRKSTTTTDIPTALNLSEQPSKELTPVSTLETTTNEAFSTSSQLPTHFRDLEVERLRVHALQAGQIMVSQLHGVQISAEDLECKSGSLIVKNIALPDGFIEDIVERVRTTDRSQLLTSETQTSLQSSHEMLSSPAKELIPPPKPPRQRDTDAAKHTTTETSVEIALQQLRNYDEETQTEPIAFTATFTSPPPPVYTTTEYLHAIPPIGFYNLRRTDEQQYTPTVDSNDGIQQAKRQHHHHHHHHRHRRCDSTCSECEDDDDDLAEREETRSRSRSRRSRSSTRSPIEPQTVTKAGQQFISACSLSIVNMINRLTAIIRGADSDKNVEAQVRNIPTIVALFFLISFTLIVYLLSGRNVHTHHWDFFNPPGNGPRPT